MIPYMVSLHITVKNSPAYAGDTGDPGWVPGRSLDGTGKIPWRRKWQPTPVFLPREFHAQRSLAGYSSWDHKESDMTEQQSIHT